MADFADLILHALGLIAQALAVGGVAFALTVVAPSPGVDDPRAFRRALAIAGVAAALVALVQAGMIAIRVASLGDAGQWLVAPVLETTFGVASVARIAVAVATAAACLALRRAPSGGVRRFAAALSAVGIAVTSAFISHAVARVDHRGLLVAFDVLHQVGASTWVGGLVHLIVAFASRGSRPSWGEWAGRFATLGVVGVILVLVGGVGLSVAYVDGPGALVETAYGLMVLTKVLLFGGMLVLGALNFRTARRVAVGVAAAVTAKLRGSVEVEVAIGLVGMLVAASLTTLPPAADVVAGRATISEVVGAVAPRWPTLTTPTLSELEAASRAATAQNPDARTIQDAEWSEYNHNVSGLFLAVVGILAALRGRTRWRWARHWPLGLIGLAAFLFLRSDPGSWPLGAEGFWEGFADAEVLQHRFFVVLVVAFATFEWLVSTRRIVPSRWGLVFPVACMVGAGFLLLHSHSIADPRSLFLMEISHALIALLGLTVGLARWLEIRLDRPEGGALSRVWGVCLALVGVVLLFYNEG